MTATNASARVDRRRFRLARGATVNDATDRPNEGSIRRASIRAWTTAGSRRGVESLCNYTVPDET